MATKRKKRKRTGRATSRTATGSRVLAIAGRHVGENYVLGVVAPKNNVGWTGPWDCAEFASWLVYQVSRKLYGCNRNSGDPATADAYTGFWARDAKARGRKISLEQAARPPGAAVLRAPRQGQRGHIVISDGRGGTVEAHSTRRGVIAHTLDGRRWDTGVLVPGIRYETRAVGVAPRPPRTVVYRFKRPLMKGPTVR